MLNEGEITILLTSRIDNTSPLNLIALIKVYLVTPPGGKKYFIVEFAVFFVC